MADFGICENPDCKLSYDSLILAGLFGRIDAVNGTEKRKVDFSWGFRRLVIGVPGDRDRDSGMMVITIPG
jgi:hypothetical protein